MPDTEDILRNLLEEWKTGVDKHDPGRVAAVFTEDAIFQGLHPYSTGRQGVHDYYESQPVGLTVEYRFHETRRLSDDVALAYLQADFTRPDAVVIPLNLSVVTRRDTHGRWAIAFYQVSAVVE
ncbi:MAG: SgcJ/EcaC family oxidoreductase [Nocardiaceae bacterium]|nr:SgcJ/EcaC family oxidoreductase [Nocardiaceae bacterium]